MNQRAGSRKTDLWKQVLLGVLVGIFSFLNLSNYIFHDLLLRLAAIPVEGQVTSHQTYLLDESFEPVHNVTYSWEVDGHHFSSTIGDTYLYDNYREGASISLVYLRNDPGTAKPVAVLASGKLERNAVLYALMVAISVRYIVYCLRDRATRPGE